MAKYIWIVSIIYKQKKQAKSEEIWKFEKFPSKEKLYLVYAVALY